MHFDFSREPVHSTVKTGSSCFRNALRGLPRYADRYRATAQADTSEAGFGGADDFVIELTGFAEGFGRGRL